jgi:hypothetical protein
MKEHAVAALVCLAAGAAAAALVVRAVLRPTHRALYRTNVSGSRVPVVLGAPVVIGGLLGMLPGPFVVEATAGDGGAVAEAGALVVLVALVMGYAGLFDDLRGDEPARGLAGHLTAARGRRVTGGIVKVAAGVIAGGLAGAFLESGSQVVVVAVLVALTANFVNLLDRAPGRAAKVWLLVAAPVAVFGSPAWAVAAAGTAGALVACLPFDLSERAMLGDAGANPLGAVAGLGLAMSLGDTGRVVAVAVLAAVTLASEKYSFSRVIDAVPPLRGLDRLGRRNGLRSHRK